MDSEANRNGGLFERILWNPLHKSARYLLAGENDWNQYLHFQVQILYTFIFTAIMVGWFVFELAVGNWSAAAAFGITLFVGLSSIYLAIKIRLIKWWFHFATCVGIVSICFANHSTGGPAGANQLVFMFLMVSAPCALGRSGLIWSAVCVLAAIGFQAAASYGYQFPNEIPPDLRETDTLVTFVSSLAGTFLVLWSYEATRHSAVEKFMASEAALRQSQEALGQAQRMETLGRLAGGIAHDFNNLLVSIIGCSQYMETQLGKGHPCQQDVKDIIAAGKQAANLTQQLLAFSARQVLKPAAVNLNQVVEDTRGMLGRILGEKVEVVTALDRNLKPAMLDTGQTQQVLMNLAINAAQAMDVLGTLAIETRSTIRVFEEGAQAGEPVEAVLLRVADTGEGMAPELVDKVFEPFYSTRDSGTGLGLAVVAGIVKQHRGDIEVESRVGVGTTFSIYFPAVDAPAEGPALSETGWVSHPGGGEHILVVEDDPSVSNYVQKVLGRNGYQVSTAESAEQALEVLARSAAEIDLVFSDVVMPGMSGDELASRVAADYPQISVLLTSGYAGDLASLARDSAPRWPFLGKPYEPEELFDKLHAVLRSKRAPEAQP